MTKLTLHDYQVRAVEHLHAHPRAALWLPVGLGKTAITLSALTDEHLPVLITGPKRVAENVWRIERDKWRPDLSIAVAKGTLAQRREALASGADIVVIGRDNLKDALDGPWRTFVMDEASGFKDRSTRRWKNAHALCGAAAYVWELTGTPASNGLMDLWAQLHLLDSGQRLSPTITQFRERFFTPGRQLASGVVTEWKLNPGADQQIHSLVGDICLSMPEDLIDLPGTVFNDVAVPLSGQAVQTYEQMRQDLVADLTMLGEGAIHTAANAAVATNKLSQIACGFLYPDPDTNDPIAHLNEDKLDAVEEILNEINSPVLVFYRYTEEKRRLLALAGAESVDAPYAIERWNAGQTPVLLAHPASAGHGLNLQYGGHTIIWTSPPWSLEHYIQANGRLARQGQTHRVMIHHLIAPKTVDEAVLTRLHSKTSVQDALLAATKGA